MHPETHSWLKSGPDQSEALHQFTHISYQLLARRAPHEELEAVKDLEEVGDAIRFASGTALLATVELARMANLAAIERHANRLLASWYPSETQSS